MANEYKRSLLDEIDWKIIDQLHTAVSNFSSASVEVKKIFFALITGFIAIALRLTSLPVDWKTFVSAYVLIAIFWYLDSFTFFYQELLRERIDERMKKILERNQDAILDTSDYLTLEDSRTNKDRLIRSAFTPSVFIYPIVALINTAVFLIYAL